MAVKVDYRSVFISDVHLGSSVSHADEAAEFLRHVRCQYLYLVGDIIDVQRLRSRWYWPASHNRFIQRVLKMSVKGTKVVYVPGNHDDAARRYVGLTFGGVALQYDAVHTTADGRRLWITHGDFADTFVNEHRFLSALGGTAYDWLVWTNRLLNKTTRKTRLGDGNWRISQTVKGKVKKACMYVSQFEETLVRSALERGVDGVLCGHIHKAEARRMTGSCGRSIDYYNCGDWVESATALVEHDNGNLSLVHGPTFVEPLRKQKPVQPDLEPAMPTSAQAAMALLAED